MENDIINTKNNLMCLIDNIVNYIPDTTDAEKVQTIREVLQQFDI